MSHLAILRYRKVGTPTGDDWLTSTAVPETQFDAQLGALRRARWEVVGAAALVDALEGAAALPERAVLITFDGGYRSLLDHALPALHRFRFPGVVFVATDRVGEITTLEPGVDEPEAMCDWDELAGFDRETVSIESLGRTGGPLSALDPVALEREATGSRGAIETRLKTPVRLFAYPRGDRGADPVATAKILRLAGYRAALAAGGGVAGFPIPDPFHVARIMMTQGTDLEAELAAVTPVAQ